MIGAVEFGGSWRIADFKTTDLSPSAIDIEAEEDEFNGAGLMLGIRGWYVFTPSFFGHLGVRSHIAGKSVVSGLLGLTVRL